LVPPTGSWILRLVGPSVSGFVTVSDADPRNSKSEVVDTGEEKAKCECGQMRWGTHLESYFPCHRFASLSKKMLLRSAWLDISSWNSTKRYHRFTAHPMITSKFRRILYVPSWLLNYLEKNVFFLFFSFQWLEQNDVIV
jgi:hypothetical protein